jgi:pyocin large subunit-like protein
MNTPARTFSILAAAAAITVSLAGCGGGPAPSETACKQAMTQAFESAMASGASASPAGEPQACKGLPQPVIDRLASEVVASALIPSPASS